MFVFFQHHHPGTIGQHKPIPLAIPGTGRGLGVIVAGGKRACSGESCNTGPRGRHLGATGEQMERLRAYLELLERWQSKINLVGRATLDDAWRRHVLDSAQLVRYLPETAGPAPRAIADMGSGAGFPGLVLAILGAGDVQLIESDGRKAAFLAEARRVTEAPAAVHRCRIEDYAGPAADVVTARALAPLADLLSLAEAVAGPGARALFPKGRSWAAELTEAQTLWHIEHVHHPSLADAAGAVLEIHAFRRHAR